MVHLVRPARARSRVGGARVRRAAARGDPLEDLRDATLREAPEAESIAGAEHLGCLAERAIAGREEQLALLRRQLVWRSNGAAYTEKAEWTIIYHEEAREESVRSAEAIARPSPQPLSTYFAPTACISFDRALGMLGAGLSRLRADREPAAHHLHVAKRYARLRHAEVAGVHADDEHAMTTLPVALQVFAVRDPRVRKRVVHMADRPVEAQARDIAAQVLRDVDQR